MTDRELLEAAAKAIGMTLTWSSEPDLWPQLVNEYGQPCDIWNPLADDGDALRLAVKRRFHVNIFSASSAEGIDTPGFIEIWSGDIDPIRTEWVVGGDYESATRRAITRAAAAMA